MSTNDGEATKFVPEYQWVGGANIPTKGGGRVNAGFGFARLGLRGNTVEMSLRGRFIRSLTRPETFEARPTDLASVFPIRSRFRFRGIGFVRPDGREYYFKTGRTDEILGVLRWSGFPVTDQPGKAAKIWTGVP